MKLVRFEPYRPPRELTAAERDLLAKRLKGHECFERIGIRPPVAMIHLGVMLAVLSLHGSYGRAGLWFLRMALHKTGQRLVDRAGAFWYRRVLRRGPADLERLLEQEEDEEFLDEFDDALAKGAKP